MAWLNPRTIMEIPLAWNFFWNAVYVLCPPREYFNSPRYNKFLDLVSFYGSLNIRAVIMKAYQVQPSAAPPVPKQPDSPPKEEK